MPSFFEDNIFTEVKIVSQFQVYAPLTTKSLSDEELIIEGIASTTNKDLVGDTITEEAIASMKDQALGLNIYDGHSYGVMKDLIGNIIEVPESDDNTLVIKAKILPSCTGRISELLDNGIPLGLSIGGDVSDYDNSTDGYIIKDFNLREISLTAVPANWDTYGTVTTSKGLVCAKSLLDACKTVIKNGESNMAEEQNNAETPVVSDEVKTEIETIVAELWSEKEEGLIETITSSVESKLQAIVEEQIANTKSEEEPDDEEEAKSTEEEETEEKPKDEETKSTDDEDDKEELAKSLVDIIEQKQADFEARFFKNLDAQRAPETNVKLDAVEKSNDKNTYSLEETAKILMAKQYDANPLVRAINKNL